MDIYMEGHPSKRVYSVDEALQWLRSLHPADPAKYRPIDGRVEDWGKTGIDFHYETFREMIEDLERYAS